VALPGPAPAALRWPPARGGRADHPKEKSEREKGRERIEGKERGANSPPQSTHRGPGGPLAARGWRRRAGGAQAGRHPKEERGKLGGGLGLEVEKSCGGEGDGDFGGGLRWW